MLDWHTNLKQWKLWLLPIIARCLAHETEYLWWNVWFCVSVSQPASQSVYGRPTVKIEHKIKFKFWCKHVGSRHSYHLLLIIVYKYFATQRNAIVITSFTFRYNEAFCHDIKFRAWYIYRHVCVCINGYYGIVPKYVHLNGINNDIFASHHSNEKKKHGEQTAI